MSKTLIFNSKISKDSLLNLEDNLSSGLYDKVLFESVGGESYLVPYFVEVLERYNVELIAYFEVSSAAFQVFIEFNGKKSLDRYFSFSIIHLSSLEIESREIGLKSSAANQAHKELKKYNKRMKKVYKTFLSNKEYKLFKKGVDVVLSRSKVKKIIKNNYAL